MANTITVTAAKANTSKAIEYLHPTTGVWQDSNIFTNVPAGIYNLIQARLKGSSPAITATWTQPVTVTSTGGTTPAKLTAPTGLAATPTSPTSVGISWNSVANATAYRVQRATDAAFTAGVALIYSGTGTSYVDNGVSASSSYYYRVLAEGSGAYSNSDYSGGVPATTGAAGGGGLTFAPQSGAPGNEITLTATGLTGATAVALGGKAAFSFMVVNDTTITATVPAGAATGPWQVTKADGSTIASSANFVYVMPAITATTLSKSANTGKINVVCGITSLTFGAQVADQYPGDRATGGSPYSWPGRLKVALEAIYGVGNVTVHNRAINGQTLQQAIAARATDVDPYYDTAAGVQNWYIGEFLANETYVGGQNSTAAQGLSYIDTYVDAIRARGFQIGICTDTPRQHNQDFQDKLAITNAAIRGNRFVNKRLFTADVGATQLGDAGGAINAVDNTRWYHPDQCHRTVEGYKLAADMILNALTPWLNPVQAQTDPGYVEDPSESAVPFIKPALYIPNTTYAKLLADAADGSRAQATGDTPNFANTARSTQALSPVTTQWIGEVKYIVQDLQDKVIGLGGANVTIWTELNYGIYFSGSGGEIKMTGNTATVESGSVGISNVAVGTAFKLKLTKTKVFVYQNAVLLATIARTESIDLYAAACMSKDQSITAFQLRAYKLV